MSKLGVKRNIIKYLLNTVTVLVLIINLFPIGWMAYNSFKGNTEILSGKVAPKKAESNVIFLQEEDNVLFVGTSDGALTRINKANNNKKYFTLKSLSTNFFADSEYIWVVSSDKGLIQLDKTSLKRLGTYELPMKALPTVELLRGKPYTSIVDVAQIGKISIASSADKLWLVAESVNIRNVIEFDKDSKQIGVFTIPENYEFSEIRSITYDGGNDCLWIGTDSVLLKRQLANKMYSVLDVNDMYLPAGSQTMQVLSRNEIVLHTITGLYLIDSKNNKLVKRYFDENEVASSDEMNAVAIAQDKIIAGTNSGLLVIDKESGKVTRKDAQFAKLVGEYAVDPEEVELSPVRSIFVDGQKILIGASAGRVSLYQGEVKNVQDKVQTSEGHILMFSRGWRNYVDMWPNVDFWKYLKNSFIICGATMIIAMILATMTAYALVRFNFPGKQFFSTSILVTQMIPAIFYLIPIYMLFNIIKSETATWEFLKAIMGPDFDGIMIKGSFPGLIFIYSAWFLPFSIWILRGFFAAIPVDLEEAATIDGCSNLGVFWKITLPLAIPGIIATGIFILIQAWDELIFAWMLTNEKTQTIPVGIRLFVGNYQNRYDLMMAAATIATIPVLILFFMLQKHIVKGLTAGAVKG